MDKVLIGDIQFGILKRAADDLTENLPEWLCPLIYKVGGKADEMSSFLNEKTKRDDVKMIVLHASGIGGDPVASAASVAKLYNGSDRVDDLRRVSIPIIVTSNGNMDRFKHLPVLKWDRARWKQKANEAHDIQDFVGRTLEECKGLANLYDLHQIYRTVFIAKNMCEPGRSFRQVQAAALPDCDETLDRIKRVYELHYSDLEDLAVSCFETTHYGAVSSMISMADSGDSTSFEGVSEDERQDAAADLSQLLNQLDVLTARLNVGGL